MRHRSDGAEYHKRKRNIRKTHVTKHLDGIECEGIHVMVPAGSEGGKRV